MTTTVGDTRGNTRKSNGGRTSQLDLTRKIDLLVGSLLGRLVLFVRR